MALPPGQHPSSRQAGQQPAPPSSPPAVIPGGTPNTPDAPFCMHCGASLSGPPLHLSTRWRQLLALFLQSNLIAAVVAAAIGAAMGVFIPQYLDALKQHPSDAIVTHLMEEEARAGIGHDWEHMRRLYASDAVVADASCSSNHPDIRQGINEIVQRYQTLPTVLALAHVNVAVSWEPDSSEATKATATAETIGEISNPDSTRQFLGGYEQWTFARIDNQWLITSFIYNLCLPSKP